MTRAGFFALLAVVWFGVFPYNFGLNNPNESARTYTTIALVEHHSFRIDEEVARFGHVNDNAVRGGHQYAAKAPATALLGVPVYALARPLLRRVVAPDDPAAWLRATTLVLRLVVVQLPCFLFLVWFRRRVALDTQDEPLALVATAALAVGSNFVAYGLMFASHALIGCAAFAAFALASDRRRPFVVGNLLGLCTLLEYTAAPLSLVLGLYALLQYDDWRARGRFVAGAALHALVLCGFQWIAFGGPFTPPHHFLADETLRANHVHGFYGVGAPTAAALHGLLLDPTTGLFGVSPFAWLVVLALFAWRRSDARWAAAASLAMVLAVAGVTNWRGGWCVGPRYLVGLMPFVAWLCAVGAAAVGPSLARAIRGREEWVRSLARGAFAGLAVASAATCGLVSIVINTLPYDVHQPLAEVALPLLRAGFVPHHAGELVGLGGPGCFYVVVAALFAAALVAALSHPRDLVVRAPVLVVVAALALWPALQRRGDCPHTVARLTEIWEPPGRDRLATLRARAHADPCLWSRVGALERGLCWQGADDDALRAFGHDCRR